jgi:hypothetical protein
MKLADANLENLRRVPPAELDRLVAEWEADLDHKGQDTTPPARAARPRPVAVNPALQRLARSFQPGVGQ